mgnify:CR=1 FL=1
MKKFIFIIFFSFFIFKDVNAKNGSGELKFSTSTMKWFIQYLYGSNDKFGDGKNKKNNPFLMAVSVDGKSTYYYFCPYTITQCQDSMSRSTGMVAEVIDRCEKLSGGTKCYLFAKFRKIVWDNGSSKKARKIPRKLLKDPYRIAQIVQEIGFYDGDITQLPAIDYETGLVDNSRKITGEKTSVSKKTESGKKKSKITKKTSEKKDDNDVVKKLKELNELYKTGALSKEEFDKAKKKILN